MIIQKRFFIWLLLFIAVDFGVKSFAQSGVYIDPNRGNKIYKKTLVMNSNRVESKISNWGTFGSQAEPVNGTSGVWPKGTSHGHVHEMTLLVAAEVTDVNGKLVHIESESYGSGNNTDPDGTQWWWTPLPGYANEFRKFVNSDGTTDSTAQVGHSADKTTWPPSWPGKDATWDGTWNGYFGQNQFSADDEAFYVIDDFKNKKYPFYPIASDTTKRGLGLQCETRLFQWAHPLAQDLIFIHFQITNVSDNDYNKDIFMGAFADTHPGGLGSSNDEDTYSTPDNMVYAWAHNDVGIWTTYRDVKPGFMAWKYLESPGNADDGIDNNNNGLIDERRDNSAGTEYKGRDNVIAAFFGSMADSSKFMKTYGYTAVDQIPCIHEEVWWTGDENGNWDIKTDDVGTDGIGPEDPSYKLPDADGSEGNGKPDQGEPNFGKNDKNESDQIGLTSFASPKYGEVEIGQDSLIWADIQPGIFDTPAQNQNNLWIFASGPFDMKKQKTERFSVVWVFAANRDQILANARIAQIIYDNNYRFSKPPTQPILKAVAGDKKVTLYWDNRSESSKDPIYGYDFEGYKLYRGTDAQLTEAQLISDAFGNKTYNLPIAQYDLIDNVKGLNPVVLGSESGDGSSSVGIQYYMGTDSGLKYSYVDTTVKNGFTYYYALVAYDRGYWNAADNKGVSLDTLLGIPNRGLGKMSPSECSFSFTYNSDKLVGESINTAIVVPNGRSTNYKAGYVNEADKDGYVYTTTDNIVTSGKVKTDVVNPDILPKNNQYEITFTDTLGAKGEFILKTFTVKNVTKDSTLLLNIAVPTDLATGSPLTTWLAPAADGIKFSFENVIPNLTKITSLSDWAPGSQTNLIGKLTSLSGTNFAPIAKNFILEVTDTVGSYSSDTKKQASYFKIYDKLTSKPIPYIYNTGGYLNGGKITKNTTIVIRTDAADGATANAWRLIFNAVSDATVTEVDPVKGDQFVMVSDVPFNNSTKIVFTTSESTVTPVSGDVMNQIKVVPNPYIVSAKWERASSLQGRGDRKISFNHLPAQCTIRIYTQNGTLLKTIQHAGVVSNGSESWDLTTSEGLEVAFGIYVYHIESPGIGKKIGTFGIIN